jgi:peptidoglycan/LPS O-acetylase OafA/YrhL
LVYDTTNHKLYVHDGGWKTTTVFASWREAWYSHDMQRQTIAFVEVLRGAACLLVVYCHVLGGRAEFYKYDWTPFVLIRDYVLNPLGIIQNFGFFGVALFFVISGFIITHSAQRETRRTFLVRRLFRIYPTLWFALAIALALHWADWWLTGAPNMTQQLFAWENVASLTALNPLFRANGPLPVIWTLSIELFFYFYALMFLPLMRHRPLAAFACFIAVSIIGVQAARWLYPHIGHWAIGEMHQYLPVFAIGMMIYFAWAGRITVRMAASLSVLAWFVLIYNLTNSQPLYLAHPTSYTTQIAYAIAVFLAALWAMPNATENPAPVRFFSEISYSLYLIHYPVGVLMMDRLYPVVGFTGAAAVSLASCVGLSVLSYWLVEQPSQKLARELTASPRAVAA